MGFSGLSLVTVAECPGRGNRCREPASACCVPTAFPLNDSDLGVGETAGITSHILGTTQRLRLKLKIDPIKAMVTLGRGTLLGPTASKHFYQLPPAVGTVSGQGDGFEHYSQLLKISS